MLVLLPTLANGAQITMTNPQEEQTENSRTLCTYENSMYSLTYITKGSCPCAKTFDTGKRNNYFLKLTGIPRLNLVIFVTIAIFSSESGIFLYVSLFIGISV